MSVQMCGLSFVRLPAIIPTSYWGIVFPHPATIPAVRGFTTGTDSLTHASC